MIDRMEPILDQLEEWVADRISRLKDATDRDSFLAAASERLDLMWDERKKYPTAEEKS